MQKSNAETFVLVDGVIDLLEQMQEMGNTQSQLKSVAQGFKKYCINFFKKQNISSKVKKNFIFKLVENYFNIDASCGASFAQLILLLLEKLSPDFVKIVNDKIREQLIQFIKSQKLDTKSSKKCLTMIKIMNLYHFFKNKDLVEILMSSDIRDVISFVSNENGQIKKELIQAYILKQSSKNSKLVNKIITQFKLNPKDYPLLLKSLIKKSLNYYLSSEQIFSVDLKIKGRNDVAEILVEILIERNQKKQALHFINKYYLQKFYYLTDGNKNYNKNILEVFDSFCPTEKFLCEHLKKKYQKKCYIELNKYGFSEDKVLFVDSQNLTQEILQSILQSPEFGLDCESCPIFCTYEQRITSTIQIAIDYKVKIKGEQKVYKNAYILDLLSLKNSQKFTKWFIESLCINYKGKIVGHTVFEDFKDVVQEIFPQKHNFKIDSLNFYDVKKKFQQKVKQTRCSLEYICSYLLNENLSKFQQCSGWQNRPLRKAQLHYAALDAVVPLIIKKKLQNM